ncbi:MAG: dienelactone hydrolase family protein [Ideonella sp.]
MASNLRNMPIKLRCAWVLAGLVILTGAHAQESVQVTSLDQQTGTPTVLPGFWFSAGTEKPAPAMLLLHGCGGVYNSKGKLALRYRDLAARLNAMGVHVLVTDSLTPRGERELCTQKNGHRAVTQRNRRRDALGALQWLAGRPDVDPARLGMLGWSNGGSTVLAASNQSNREVQASPAKPSLSVAFYPGCASEAARGYRAVAPLLVLIGDADDWTPAEPCRQLAQQASGAAVQIETYPGAYHDFDGGAPVRVRHDVPNGVHPGQGVHVGGQPEAKAASALALESFLRNNWKL